ncbi:unnamed protein product [Plutella xylostella]|uniref:(diamondback moth) hypothetical protein n=1 Tax=Plutella xylostella TaxID=51655 RepID=A0A8S4G616_PLUXY|nr:unnamed protein product [Plutella xylostella]
MRWQVGGGMGLPLAAAVVLMLPIFTSSTGDIRHHGTSRQRGWRGVQGAPEAAANNSVSNVTAQLGGTAFLHCLVGHLNERGQVSWIRKRDWHILSSGKFTYTNDERFQVLHGEGTEDWTLQIKFVQKRDNGTYECQGWCPTTCGCRSWCLKAFILGSGEHHVDLGSVIHLICIVEKSPVPPQYVFWYHNARMINYDALRGGITVETEPGARTPVEADRPGSHAEGLRELYVQREQH